MNAYLPSLAKESPEVVKAYAEFRATQDNHHHEYEDESVSDNLAEPLVRNSDSEFQLRKSHYEAAFSRATSRISSSGIALGYGAGIFLLFIALIPVTKMKGTTFSLRLAISLSGIWWAVFSIPALMWLPGGQGQGQGSQVESDEDAVWVDTDTRQVVPAGKWSLWKEIAAAWKRLGGMLRWSEIKKLQNTFRFLAAWFLLSDG